MEEAKDLQCVPTSPPGHRQVLSITSVPFSQSIPSEEEILSCGT